MSIAADIYKKYQAQTFPYPSLLEIKHAKDSYIYDINDKKYPPIIPEYVLFGLIFVNFGPLKILPKK